MQFLPIMVGMDSIRSPDARGVILDDNMKYQRKFSGRGFFSI